MSTQTKTAAPRRRADLRAPSQAAIDAREAALCTHHLTAAGQAAVRRALRVLEASAVYRTHVFTSPHGVREYLRLKFAGLEHEVFLALWLDSQNGLIEAEETSRGTVTQASVYPREIVKSALAHNASCVILAHNHPSGHAQPSRADETLIATLKAALALVDIRILDHFVIAGDEAYSFAEHGLLA